MHIASLYRYPVKGLSPERLSTVQVATAEGFPLDRMYALLRTQADFDAGAPVWLAKANFVMLMMHEQIAGLKTHYLHQDKKLFVTTATGRQLEFLLGESAGRAALEQFFADFMPKHLTTAPRLVESTGHQFTDKAAKYISLITSRPCASWNNAGARVSIHCDFARMSTSMMLNRLVNWTGSARRSGSAQ